MNGLLRALFFVMIFVIKPAPASENRFDFSLPEGVSIDGIVGHYQHSNQSRAGTLQTSAILGTNSRVALGAGAELKFAGWGGFFQKTQIHPTPHGQGEVREASIAFSHSGYDLEVGQLYLPWGKTDGINPTDYLTARDYRFLSSEDIYKRRGAPGVSLGFCPMNGTSPVRFDFVGLGKYAQSELYIPSTAVPAGILLNQTSPSNNDQEYAGKASYMGSGWDFSLSAFHGRIHAPQFTVQGSEIKKEFLKRDALGADFSKSLSNYVLRWEAAYFHQKFQSQMRTEPNHLDAVLGLERGFGDHARLIVQFVYKYYEGWSDPAGSYTGSTPQETQIGRALATANALLLSYQNESNPGSTLSYQFTTDNDLWALDLSLVAYFVSHDYLVRPLVGYKVSDHFRIQVGADVYGGPQDRPLGALKESSHLFAEIKAGF